MITLHSYWSSCLYLLGTGIKGMYYHAWQNYCFFLISFYINNEQSFSLFIFSRSLVTFLSLWINYLINELRNTLYSILVLFKIADNVKLHKLLRMPWARWCCWSFHSMVKSSVSDGEKLIVKLLERLEEFLPIPNCELLELEQTIFSRFSPCSRWLVGRVLNRSFAFLL